jgi:CheY-like chemotaxis protein
MWIVQPLTSIVGGIEFIDQVARDLQALCRSATPGVPSPRPLSPEQVEDCIRALQHCVTNFRTTNAFMLMTINRCIDYTKASKGLKLVPKPETINLMETLQLPMQCLLDVQTKLPIKLLEVPSTTELCSHIITDKQWLQENVLCLLSNAVKYSSEGDVTIAVQLITLDVVDFEQSNRTTSNRSQQGSFKDHQSVHNSVSIPRSYSSKNLQVLPTNKPDITEDVQIFARSPTASRTSIQSSSKPLASKTFLRLEVEDHGIGITPEIMQSLFAPFKQAQRFAGGTGLGLYSLAKRVEALHGRCGVSSRHDGTSGSLFWFEIPYRPDMISAANAVVYRPRFPTSIGKKSTHAPTKPSTISTNDSLPVSLSTSTMVESYRVSGRNLPDPKLSSTKWDLNDVESDDDNEIRDHVETLSHTRCTKVACNSVFDRQNSHIEESSAFPSSPPPDATPSETALVPLARMNSLTRAPSARLGFSDLSILLVDDSPAILKLTAMMLRRHGHQTTSAENGAEALKCIKDQLESHHRPFDVILMDLQMPVMDGLEATKRIRAMEEDKNKLIREVQKGNILNPLEARSSKERKRASIIRARLFDTIVFPFQLAQAIEADYAAAKLSNAPKFVHHAIIGVSANSDDVTTQEALQAGMDAFLSKPFSIDSFYKTLSATRKKLDEEV